MLIWHVLIALLRMVIMDNDFVANGFNEKTVKTVHAHLTSFGTRVMIHIVFVSC